MSRSLSLVAGLVAALIVASSSVVAQQVSSASVAVVSASSAGTVPSLVSYSGVLKDSSGRTTTGITGVTFLLYNESQGGAPLWLETQSVTPDKTGHYSVQLGSTTSTGLPAAVFLSGEARWLAVQIAGEAEQPRVLLVAVPYAMKAADAETIGGLPPSAFVLAGPALSNGASGTTPASATSSSASAPPPASSNVTTTGGTVNAIPLFSTATNIQNSILTQTTTTAVNVGGKLNLSATGVATSTAGKNSQAQDFVASSFSSSTNRAVNQTFQWQAEPAANDTTNPLGTLNLLYAAGTVAPSETGLSISTKGLFTFATGQTFPGTGQGTITGVTTASGSGLSGGGTTGTLNLSVPAAGITNAMLASSSLTVSPGGGMTGGGSVALGGTTTLGLKTCAANQVLEFTTSWNCMNAGIGTITGVTTASGSGLSGGGTSGTLNLSVPAAGITNTMLANSALTMSPGGGMTGGGSVALGGTVTLGLKGCALNQVLVFTLLGWNCVNVPTGTVTSVASGTGLTGGTITTSGTLSLDTTKVPLLASSNVFSGTQTVGGLSTTGTISANNLTATNVNATNATLSSATVSSSLNVTGTFSTSTVQATNVNAASIVATGSLISSFIVGTSTTNNPHGPSVAGLSTATSGQGFGTEGITNSPNGSGIFGITGTSYSTVGDANSTGTGVWGDAGTSGATWAVLGTADNTTAGVFENNSAGASALYAQNENASGFPFNAVNSATGNSCNVDSTGSLNCTGAKHAVVPIDGGARRVALSAIESPKNWFEDFGSGQLSGGAAVIALDPDFAQTVNTTVEYHVFLTPNGDCKGLYIGNRTAASFEVHELGGGSSSVPFSYRIVALRKNYENIRLEDHSKDPGVFHRTGQVRREGAKP